MKRLGFLLFKHISKLLSNKGLDKVPGMKLVYNSLLHYLRPKGITLADIQGNKMYVNADDDWAGIGFLISPAHEKYETEFVKAVITEGMTVVDIGAHVGYYTLIAARLVGSTGNVYSFEPEPSNYKLLIRNIEINGYKNIIPVNKAVSNQSSKERLFLNKVNSGGHSFSSSHIPNEAVWIEVETTTLDEFFQNERVDFIKIDAEGAEGLILDGAWEILKQDGLKILMEFWPQALSGLGTNPLELLYRLQEIGFKIKIIDKIILHLSPIEIMEIFDLRRKELGELGISFHVNLLLDK